MSKNTYTCSVCGKDFDSEFGKKIHKGKSHTQPWQDEERLQELYHGKELSQNEIADKLGTSRATIQRMMNNYGIEKRKSDGDPTKPPHHSFHERSSRPLGTCDERVSSWIDGGNKTVKIHRLLAVACGKLDPEEMWNPDLKVHHKSEHGWDNRPENLEVVTQAEHREEHAGSPYRTTTE